MEKNTYLELFQKLLSEDFIAVKKMFDTVYFHYLRCLSNSRKDEDAMDEFTTKRIVKEAGINEFNDVYPIVEKFHKIK